MSFVDNTLLKIDAYAKEPLNPMKVGDKVENIIIELSSGQDVKLTNFLDKGPVLLHFIRGTWCVFCRAHLRKMLLWSEKSEAKIHHIFISSENKEKINEWKRKNGSAALFGSDPKQTLIKRFGLEFTKAEDSRPATFVIDVDQSIRMAHYSKRNNKLYKKLNDKLIG